MRKTIFTILTVCSVGCTESTNKSSNIDKTHVVENTCGEISINDFKTFLTIGETTPEVELKKILGASTGGHYSDDKSTFIYAYERIKRVPIKVYVNAKSGKIKTVFMEILGLKENFDVDVKKAKINYPIDECHAFLYGKQPKEIIELFGQANKDNLKVDNVEENVKVLQYYAEDEKTAITLNFYPSQEYRLSSIVVDWL